MKTLTLSTVPTADLLLELGSRVERAEKLFAALEGTGVARPPVEAAPKASRRQLESVEVLNCLRTFTGNASAAMVHKRLRKGTRTAVASHLKRLEAKRGGVVQVTPPGVRPALYTAERA